jgi:hypothetical protein
VAGGADARRAVSEHEAYCILCKIKPEDAVKMKGHAPEECPFRHHSKVDPMYWKFTFDAIRIIEIRANGPFDEFEMGILDEFLELVKRRIHRSTGEKL